MQCTGLRSGRRRAWNYRAAFFLTDSCLIAGEDVQIGGQCHRSVRFGDAYGVDQLRYFFAARVPFGQDGNYSHEAIVQLITPAPRQRSWQLAQPAPSYDGRPPTRRHRPRPGAFTTADKAILAMADGMIASAREAMKSQQLHQVLNTVWAVIGLSEPILRRRSSLGLGQEAIPRGRELSFTLRPR